MEVYNGIIALTYSDLTGGDNPIVKISTLAKWLQRGKARYVRKAQGLGVEALIEYNSLPLATREAVVERYGDPEELKKEKEALCELPADEVATRYYRYEYRYIKAGREVRLSDEVADEYVLNARVVQALIKKKKDLQAMRNRLGNRQGNLWDIVTDYSEYIRQHHPHTLPTTPSRVRLVCARFEKEGYNALVSGRVGNKNTAIIAGDAAEYIIALKRSRMPIYNMADIFDKYNSVCEDMGWKPLKSEQSLRNYLYQPHVRRLWADIVLGENVAHSEFGYKFTTKSPSCRDAMWASDGTRLNLYYKKVGEDGRLKLATADVYVIIDVYSGAMLAYEIGQESKSETQYKAFRKAVMFAEHRPYELVLDNQAGQKKLETQGFLGRIAHHVHFKTPYRAQANPIESIFGQFQQSVLRKHFFFTGQNITAKKKENRPNLDYIQANIDQVPDYKGLCQIYAQETEEWNNSIHPVTGLSRIETYKSSVNEQLTRCQLEDYVDMFWLETKNPIVFTASGLSITVNKVKHTYDVYAPNGLVDHAWRSQYLLTKFAVKYDPADLRQICLYTVDANGSKRFCTFASELVKVNRAMQDQERNDLAMIHGNLRADREERRERIIAGRAIDYRWGNKGIHPRVPTFSKDENEAINDEAMRRSGINVIPRHTQDPIGARAEKIQLQQAVIAKKISNTDWSEVLTPASTEEEIAQKVYAKM